MPGTANGREAANKEVVRRFIEEMWNERRLERADELIASNCVTHQLRTGEPAEGAPRSPESVKREAAMWLQGFPDLHFAILHLIAEDNLVMTHCMMEGTHTGIWMGLAPTGRDISIPFMTIHRMDAGKIVEDWVLIGSLLLFQQLGVVAPTEEIIRPVPRKTEQRT